MRIATLFAAASLAIVAPAMAQGAPAQEQGPTLEEVLADPARGPSAERDVYRHPAETLAFFGVEPTMRVAEFGPGGGWYTRGLLPWIAPRGAYIALQRDTGTRPVGEPSFAQAFVDAVVGSGLGSADDVTALETDDIAETMEGTVDRILVFRAIHGLLNGNAADAELRAMRRLLADDGMIGVVQHRAPEDARYADSNGSRGYLRQSDVIRLFELNGFALVAASEINANAADPADWPGGVWTLPPALRYGEQDRARYLAIGESDRMTLLFRKRD